MFDVSNDPDNFNGSRLALICGEPLADWILWRPVALGHRLIDDSDAEGPCAIAIRKCAARDLRDSDGPEVVRGGCPIVGRGKSLCFNRRGAFDRQHEVEPV